jgi:hypothetical protein
VATLAIVIPTATVLTAGAATQSNDRADVVCCVEHVATAPTGIGRAAADAPNVSTAADVPSAMSAGAASRYFKRPMPVGVAPEHGLQVKTILAARAVSLTFPDILDIGGVRSDYLRWHPNGLAIDVMIPNYDTAEGKLLGDRVTAFVLQQAERFGLNHVIWQQTLYPGDGGLPYRMSSAGGDTADHYDHVHIATDGGGYPTGRETYFT